MGDPTPLSKHQRMSRITYLLYRHPRGLTTTELARLCGVSKRTSERDLHDLEATGVPLWSDEGFPPRYGILEGYYLPPIHLTLDDALALYLAARLLARYADAYDPHIVEALAKLARILPEPIAAPIHATIQRMGTRDEDARFVRVLGVLALGWVGSRKVRIRHQAAHREEVREHIFCPYFIEPSSAGSATYAIGHCCDVDALRTFKVERILDAVLLDDPCTIPENFDGPRMLESAWGIMYGDELEEVVLRFAPSATRRLHETDWHPSQELEELADGGRILRVRVANPMEMVSWVRGWGPQVEVLAPAWMRRQMAGDAQEVVRMYGEG